MKMIQSFPWKNPELNLYERTDEVWVYEFWFLGFMLWVWFYLCNWGSLPGFYMPGKLRRLAPVWWHNLPLVGNFTFGFWCCLPRASHTLSLTWDWNLGPFIWLWCIVVRNWANPLGFLPWFGLGANSLKFGVHLWHLRNQQGLQEK